MSAYAEFETAPEGTQYRRDSGSSWERALVGTPLEDGFESRNIKSNEYQVKLFEETGFTMNEDATIELKNISGMVKYKNSAGAWIEVTKDGNYPAVVVGTDTKSNVSIVLCGSGNSGPRPFN